MTARHVLLALALIVTNLEPVDAQNGSLRRKTRPQVQRVAATSYETPLTDGFQYDEGGVVEDATGEPCDCGGCGGGLVGDGCGCTGVGGCGIMTVGVELSFLQPYFESNPAATMLSGDGDTFESFTDIEFDFGTELSPRVWLEYSANNQMGIRAVWWDFDHGADPVSASPDDNGFGRISNPDFGDIDLSTTVPGSTYNTTTDLHAWTLDIEGTRTFTGGCWKWLAAAGVRYAEIDQTYISDLQSAAGDLQGRIDYSHRSEGFGPTVFLRAQRPILPGISLFGSARGSLLYGDSASTLDAVEDLDLDDQLRTLRLTGRDDLLPIGEVQVGLQVSPPGGAVWRPYLHVALEGQHWAGAGNASSEDGSLGFFGFNVALGVCW